MGMKRILMAAAVATGLTAAATTASAGEFFGLETNVVGNVEYNITQEQFEGNIGGSYSYEQITILTQSNITYDSASGFDYVGSSVTALIDANDNIDLYATVNIVPGFVISDIATGIAFRF